MRYGCPGDSDGFRGKFSLCLPRLLAAGWRERGREVNREQLVQGITSLGEWPLSVRPFSSILCASAIITDRLVLGAGPGGLSAAYHTKLIAKAHNIPVDIHIYEKQSNVGGRASNIVPLPHRLGQLSFPWDIETGAKVFRQSDKTLAGILETLQLPHVLLPQDRSGPFAV